MSNEKIKFAVDRETAKDEFNRFCEAWEIDDDTAGMDEEDKAAFEGNKAKIINAIMRGRLSFQDDNTLLFDTGEEKITIKIPQGATYMEMDRYKDREGVHKAYAVLGGMTGKSPAFFARMDGRRLKPLMGIISLFLGG